MRIQYRQTHQRMNHTAHSWLRLPLRRLDVMFPNTETGTRAQRALLLTPKYQARTINGVIERYSKDNIADYQKFVTKALNLPGTTLMRHLSSEQLDQLVTAMQRFERSRPGTVREIPAPGR